LEKHRRGVPYPKKMPLKDTSIGMKGCFNADNNNAVYLKSLLQKSTKYLLENYF
jgi:hypothetical protein